MPAKAKKSKVVADLGHNELASFLYDSLYNDKEKLSFSIHSKKLEEAFAKFEAACKSRHPTTCFVVRGPSGCGKGFLVSKLLKSFERFVRIGEAEDLWEAPISRGFNDELPSSPKDLKCSKSLFPSLQFASVQISSAASSSSRALNSLSVDSRKVVTMLDDTHFQFSEYFEVKRAVQMLKSLSGIVLIEITDFEMLHDGKNQGYLLKLLSEEFSDNNFVTITMNPITTLAVKKLLNPLDGQIDMHLPHMIARFSGDVRSFLHGLYINSLNPRHRNIGEDDLRDYRTDLFHYVGKLLYPAKSSATRFFDAAAFWDIDFNVYLSFIQFYFPQFSPPGISNVSKILDSISDLDVIPWKVMNHVSLDHRYLTSVRYAPLLAAYLIINEHGGGQKRKFFSFNKPPKIENSHRARFYEEDYLFGR